MFMPSHVAQLIATIDSLRQRVQELEGERDAARQGRDYYRTTNRRLASLAERYEAALKGIARFERGDRYIDIDDGLRCGHLAAVALSAPTDEFYEEDEDPAKIQAAFDAGEKGVTAPPSFGRLVEPSGNVGNVSAPTEGPEE
jgi:hypothetical protein